MSYYGATATNGETVLPHNTTAPPSDGHNLCGEWFVNTWLELAMLVSIVLNGMGAGIMFIFSNTIMPALGKLSDGAGITTMNIVNTDIQNGWFMLVFFGGIVSIAVAIYTWNRPALFSKPARYYAIASTVACFVGPFFITVTQNVPRNDALLAFEDDPNSEGASDFWRDNFLTQWVAWNTVRTVLQVLAMIFGVLTMRSLPKYEPAPEAFVKEGFTQVV